jgi:diguanylate cyclase (GGDEF)-like protein
LSKAIDENNILARIGGDEFVILLPGYGERKTANIIERIQKLMELNNKYHDQSPTLSLSIGRASTNSERFLQKLIVQADNMMYQEKGKYYRRRKEDLEGSLE